MDALVGFAQKDMIEQITVLDEIREQRQGEAVPQLMDLYATPMGDQAVDEMVYHTLFELLADRAEDILAGLGHGSKRVRLLCIRQAGQTSLAAAKPVLVQRLAVEQDAELIGEVVRALGKMGDPGLIAILLPYLDHEDYSVAAWAMQALVDIGGDAARHALRKVVDAGGTALAADEICDLRIALAVMNLAEFVDEETIEFLVARIHHPNPSFRRVVINALVEMGEVALPALEGCLDKGDKDERIMAANIIGMMGVKGGVDVLIDLLEEGDDLDANLKFAVYEALGRINSLKSVIGLTDGLEETDSMVLMAVIIAMDHLCNPGIVKVLNEALAKGDEQSGRIVKTIANAHATALFGALYPGPHGDALVKTILEVGDTEAKALFRVELDKVGGEKAASDSKRLAAGESAPRAVTGKILAADDSKAILFFYRGVANELGVEMLTVPDGKDALEYLQGNTDIDLLITDMNMPNMDGVELTREVRKLARWAALPIVMATTESEKSQVDLARAAGVSDFISKPFTGEQLKEKIGQYL
ncbi:MAG: HEAT repeat domain-containing protein [Desulfobulbaceae bacterium]|nr:HEAT repeat domain-containing protein [Desulfobulbaceae bacterium]